MTLYEELTELAERGVEPAAWMYVSPYGKELCKFRWGNDEGITSNHWIGWTETPLIALPDILAALKERDRLRREAPKQIMDGLWPILGGDMTDAETWHDINAVVRAAIQGEPA